MVTEEEAEVNAFHKGEKKRTGESVLVRLAKTLTSLSFCSGDLYLLEITGGICENQNKTKLPQWAHDNELENKTHRRGPMASVCFTLCEGRGQSPMQSWAASPWLTRDNFKVRVCILPTLLWWGVESNSLPATQIQMCSPSLVGNIPRKFTQLFKAHYEEKQTVPPLHSRVSIMVISPA